MIIGKDKERVRLMEIDMKLAIDLISDIEYEMEQIAQQLESNKIDTTSWPYYKLYHDIGRCRGLKLSIQEHKG